jgi:GNAT superfamily N-acetyltransferase
MLNFEILPRPPIEFKALVWDVFFKSRDRGISLDAHFPWLESSDSWYVVIKFNLKVVGGLVVKKINLKIKNDAAGIVGLVCVDEKYRCRGYLKLMLDLAITEAKNRKYNYLILWTEKSKLYRKFGFEINDDSFYGWAEKDIFLSNKNLKIYCSDWPANNNERGIPPFANKCTQYSTDVANITVISDSLGPILAEWSGGNFNVLDIIRNILPKKYRLNIFASDSLHYSLIENGWTLSLVPSQLQMVLKLFPSASPYAAAYKLRVLDRI